MSLDLTLADMNVPAHTTAVIDAAHVERIAATLDVPVPTDVLPTMWHWMFFTPTTPTAGLGADGHPVLDSPVLAPFPRRMFGAGTTEWEGDLRIGSAAERTTTLTSSRHVEGGSGTLLIVGLLNELSQDGVVRLRERQSIVYRAPSPDTIELPGDGPPPAPPDGAWTEERRPAPALLFRFSAITFNAHRIHYDLPYARDVEGHPGLVVHGPLTAWTIAEFAERCNGARLASFEFKATAPLYAGLRSTVVCLPPDGDGNGIAHVVRNDGAVAMQATYRLR